jgi:hypothetical protein
MCMRSSCHVLRRLRTSDGSQTVRSPDLLPPPPLNSFPYRHPQVSSSLALHTQSMTAIHPTLILTSLSSVYRFSGSVMAYRCVHRIRFSDDPLTQITSIQTWFFFAQELAWNLGGTVAKCEHREYGSARVQVKKFGSDPSRFSVDTLFEGLGDEMEVRIRGV